MRATLTNRLLRLIAIAFLGSGCQSTGGVADSQFDGGLDTDGTSDGALDARADVRRDVGRPDVRPIDATPSLGCHASGDGGPDGIACIHSVSGRLADLAGAAIANHTITVCGTSCFYAFSGDDGMFNVAPESDLEVRHFAIHAHGRPDHSSVFIPLPAPVAGFVAVGSPFLLPRYTNVGPAIPEDGTARTVTAGDVTLGIPANAMLEFDLEDDTIPELGRLFRVAPVPPGQAAPFAVEAGLVSVYALGPFNLRSVLPMSVRVTNRAGLAAGSAVEFVVMGNESYFEPVNAGLPIVAAVGHVSADGASVSTDPGQGLEYLTWFGLRPRTR